MSTRWNFLAGLSNSAWYALATFTVVPFYLHYLGTTAYGLIGFFLTLQGLLLLLDLGLTPAVSREVSRRKASSLRAGLPDFVHTVAILYWGIAIVILIALSLFSSSIAEAWLQVAEPVAADIPRIVMLMGVAIALRFPHSIYRGVLIGAERLVLLNGINMLVVALSTFGTVLVLAFVSTSIMAFFLWQVFCGLTLTLLMRWAAWNSLGELQLTVGTITVSPTFRSTSGW